MYFETPPAIQNNAAAYLPFAALAGFFVAFFLAIVPPFFPDENPICFPLNPDWAPRLINLLHAANL